jgi:hypothetical protein
MNELRASPKKLGLTCPAPARSFVVGPKGEESMCPICIANMALVIAGATSTGGLTALVVKKLRTRRDAIRTLNSSPQKEKR